jgi:hypothetical protein
MPVAEHAVFKLVSLRAPIDSLTVDPVEDNTDIDVVERLNELSVNPIDPGPEVLRLIENEDTLAHAELERSLLAQVERELRANAPLDYSALAAIELDIDGTRRSLSDLSRTPEFGTEYRHVTSSWLALRLQQRDGPLVDRHADLVRIARLCSTLGTKPDLLREPGAIARLLRARVVFPRNWRPSLYRHEKLQARHAAKLEAVGPPDASVLAQHITQKKQEQKVLEAKIALRESIQSKAHATYWRQKQQLAGSGSAGAISTDSSPRMGGLFSNALNFLFGTPVPAFPPQSRPRMRLDDAFFTALEDQLSADERAEFSNVLPGIAAARPPS